MSLREMVDDQIRIIESGSPLDAFRKYYDDQVQMFNNAQPFATNKRVAEEVQAHFLGGIEDFKAIHQPPIINENIAILDAMFSFTMAGEAVSFRGVHEQHWQEDRVVLEHFYTGTVLEEKIAEGLLAEADES